MSNNVIKILHGYTVPLPEESRVFQLLNVWKGKQLLDNRAMLVVPMSGSK